MAKPIVVIYFPHRFMGGRDDNWIYDYMRFLNGDASDSKIAYHKNTDYYKDYYWFCFYKYDIDEPEFKVFYEKDFTDIQFQELKDLVLKSIEKIHDANTI